MRNFNAHARFLFGSSFALVCLCLVSNVLYISFDIDLFQSVSIVMLANIHALCVSLGSFSRHTYLHFALNSNFFLRIEINCSFPFSLKLSEKLVIIHRQTHTAYTLSASDRIYSEVDSWNQRTSDSATAYDVQFWCRFSEETKKSSC